jgi:hypothetical protein
MSYDDAFKRIILEDLKTDEKTIEAIRTQSNYDAYIYKESKRGDTDFSQKHLCLWYCYKYMRMHFDQYKK